MPILSVPNSFSTSFVSVVVFSLVIFPYLPNTFASQLQYKIFYAVITKKLCICKIVAPLKRSPVLP